MKKRKVGSFNQFPMSIFHHGMKALVRTHIKCARAHVKPKFHSLYHGAMEVRTEWTPNQASFQAQQVEHNNWLWRTHQPMPYVFYRTKTDAPQGRCRAHLFSLVETTHFERSSWRLWNWKTFRKNMRTKLRRKSNSGKGRNCCPPLSTWELVTMLIIGVKYDTPELCPGSKPLDFWHLVELSCMLVSSALKFLAYVTLCEFDDKIAEFLTPLLDAAYFIVIIWGSFLVFGKFCSGFF